MPDERGKLFSYSITVCTASPHDEFYFNNPHKITGDKPPQPYLALNRWEIIQRVINSELLRRAFLSLSDQIGSTGSTQGNFGQVENWRQYKQDIGNWLSNSDDVEEVFDALTEQTEFEGRHDLIAWIQGKTWSIGLTTSSMIVGLSKAN